MWPRFGDIIVIYAVLTPLCVMYWHATFQMIDKYFNNNVTSALVGGYTMVVITILLHETLRCTAESFQYKCMYEYIYDYTVFTACLSYIHGCRLAYDIVRQSLTPIVIAILIGLFLIVMRGFRNILALPAVVNTDRLVDRYRPQNTLIFFGGVPGILCILYINTRFKIRSTHWVRRRNSESSLMHRGCPSVRLAVCLSVRLSRKCVQKCDFLFKKTKQ